MECNKDCFNCQYTDCISQSKDYQDIDTSLVDEAVMDYQMYRDKNPRQYRYRHSKKGKEYYQNYMKSYRDRPEYAEQVKKYNKKYQGSEKSKQAEARRRNSEERKAYMKEYMKNYRLKKVVNNA